MLKSFRISQTIKETAKPNDRYVHLPLKSGLNIEVWEKDVADYQNERILNYLKFGFPLSLTNTEVLDNQNVINHYSALTYQVVVLEY